MVKPFWNYFPESIARLAGIISAFFVVAHLKRT
jgi:hypothetical protein